MPEIRKTRSQLKREAIVVAAKRAFIEKGIQNTSMDTLSELAQVSKRTVYNHFETKEILVMHILREMWESATVQTDIPYQSEQCLYSQLHSLLLKEATFLCSDENIELSRVAFSHFFYNTDALKQEVNKISKRETALYKWIEHAINDNRLVNMEVEFANAQLHNLLKGFCFWPLILGLENAPTTVRLEEISQETAKMFLARYSKI